MYVCENQVSYLIDSKSHKRDTGRKRKEKKSPATKKEEESLELHILHLRSWNSIIAQTQCLENDVDVILLFEIKLKKERQREEKEERKNEFRSEDF